MFPESSIRNWDKVSNKSLYTCVDGSQLIKGKQTISLGCLIFKRDKKT